MCTIDVQSFIFLSLSAHNFCYPAILCRSSYKMIQTSIDWSIGNLCVEQVGCHVDTIWSILILAMLSTSWFLKTETMV